jgi:ubiquinone/menaquinone biosynthesis C-methylase UbiE
MVPQGKVCGLDYSEESVAATKRMNARWIESGRVEVFEGSVSQLPFSDGMFDLVTGIETHFWWPSVPDGMREIFRILKPGGSLLLTAEIYKGAHTTAATLAEKYASRMDFKLLSIDEHRELFTSAGFSDVRILTGPKKGWMCGTGKKP